MKGSRNPVSLTHFFFAHVSFYESDEFSTAVVLVVSFTAGEQKLVCKRVLEEWLQQIQSFMTKSTALNEWTFMRKIHFKICGSKRNQALSPAQFGQDGCSRRPTGVPVHDIQTLFFSKIYILLCFVFSSNLRHLSAYTVSGVVGWESGAPESHFSEFPFYREDLAALKKRKSHFIEFPFCREKSVLATMFSSAQRSGQSQRNP